MSFETPKHPNSKKPSGEQAPKLSGLNPKLSLDGMELIPVNEEGGEEPIEGKNFMSLEDLKNELKERE